MVFADERLREDEDQNSLKGDDVDWVLKEGPIVERSFGDS